MASASLCIKPGGAWTLVAGFGLSILALGVVWWRVGGPTALEDWQRPAPAPVAVGAVTVGVGVADVAESVAVEVGLIFVGDSGAVVAGVAVRVAIAVGLSLVVVVRAVVTDVAEGVPIAVRL